MISLVGAVFFALFAIGLFVGPRMLVLSLAASLPFSHAAAITILDNAVSPFWMGCGFVAVRLAWATGRNRRLATSMRDAFEGANRSLLLFVAYAVGVTIISGLVFAGMAVYSPRGGIDEQLGNLTPFSLTVSSFAQILYLLLGVITVIWFVVESPTAGRAFELAIYLVFGLTLWHSLLPETWPIEIFDSNPNYSYMNSEGARERGPFAEPSVLGMFVVAAISYSVSAFMPAKRSMKVVYSIIIVVGLYIASLAAAGTAIMTGAIMGLVAAMLFVARSVMSRKLGRLAWAGGIAIGFSAILAATWNVIAPHTLGVVIDKLGSDSLTNRNASNGRAWEIFVETWGVGLGLGANRPSSFVFMLLSCVGVIGFLLFTRSSLGYWLVGMSEPRTRPLAWALVATLVAQAVAIPDLSSPQLWFLLGAVATLYRPRLTEARTESTRPAMGVSPLRSLGDELGVFANAYLRSGGARNDYR